MVNGQCRCGCARPTNNARVFPCPKSAVCRLIDDLSFLFFSVCVRRGDRDYSYADQFCSACVLLLICVLSFALRERVCRAARQAMGSEKGGGRQVVGVSSGFWLRRMMTEEVNGEMNGPGNSQQQHCAATGTRNCWSW